MVLGERLVTVTGVGGWEDLRRPAGRRRSRRALRRWRVVGGARSRHGPGTSRNCCARRDRWNGGRSQPAEETLVLHLRSISTLIVIDNCEHLVEAVAAVVHRVVEECPHVHVLTTSREPLGVGAETTWRTPSLPSDEAAALFAERARRARSNFVITAETAGAVARICERLDGIPLAIELAAARVRALPVNRLAADLDQRFRLLTGGSRTAPARQRTLLASVDWSYDLLDDTERSVLRRLSAFVDGFTLDAAENVCADEALDTYAVLDVLTNLVDKSLVQLDEHASRYRLLETIRHYALDRAGSAGELAVTRDRHLRGGASCWAQDGTSTTGFRPSDSSPRSRPSMRTC